MASDKITQIVLGVFDRSQHNRRYLRHIYEYIPGEVANKWTATTAAQCGHKSLTQMLLRHFPGYYSSLTSQNVVKQGWLDILQEAHEVYGHPIDTNMARRAAQYGHVHIIQYLHEHGIELNEMVLHLAIINCHVNVAQYLIENKLGMLPHPEIYTYIKGRVDESRYIQMLEYLDSLGIPIHCPTSVANWAAIHGHLLALQYLAKKGIHPDNGGAEQAAINGHLHILQYLYANQITSCKHYGVRWAAESGHLPVVQFLYDMGEKYDTDNVCEIARKGYFDVIQFLFAQGVPLHSQDVDTAAINGHFHIVRFCYENGKRGGVVTWHNVVAHGDVDLLQLIHQHEHPPWLSDYAMHCEHVHTLQWFFNIGVVPSLITTFMNCMVNKNRLDMVQFLYEHGYRYENYEASRIRQLSVEMVTFLAQYH